MDFKIDTKDAFTTIVPQANELSAILAATMASKITEIRQSGSGNVIVDLSECSALDENTVDALVALHEASYAIDQSLVFTGLNAAMLAAFKKNEKDLLVNIAPTMIEAVDIISMEILERDLLSEE